MVYGMPEQNSPISSNRQMSVVLLEESKCNTNPYFILKYRELFLGSMPLLHVYSDVFLFIFSPAISCGT